MADHIPKEFLELLLQRVDLVGLVDGRIPLRKKTGSNFFTCCPFHQEKTASFSVSQTKQFYYCFGCGAHGNAIDFMIHYDRLSFPEAVESLAKSIGMTVPHSKSQEKSFSLQHLYNVLEKAAAFYQEELKKMPQAQAYFKQRGITDEIIKTFYLGYSPRGDALLQHLGKSPQGQKELQDCGIISNKDGRLYDRFRERILFPIQDKRGRFIGFGGRVLDQGEPKYLNSPETAVFQKGHELYGLYQVLKINRELPRILIVEGYMDMISLFQHGVTYAVATLGTATTPYHVQALFRYTSEIVFCFDGDNAGRRAASRALQVVLPIVPDNVQFRFMFLPDGEDPDSLVRKEGQAAFEKLIQEADTLSQYFFKTIEESVDRATVDSSARYHKAGMDQIKNMQDGIFKQALLKKLSDKTGLDAIAPGQSASPEKAAPQTVKRPPAASKRSSMLRNALAILIQHPELAQSCKPFGLKLEDTPGITLFNQVWEMAARNAQLNTGSLLELWRGQPEEKWLASLAQQELTVPEKGLQAELLGALQQIEKQALEQEIQRQLEKHALGTLSPEEVSVLNNMIINNKKEKEVL